MRIQSSHSHEDRAQDAYFTPPEATIALINIEQGYIPNHVWEPACGDGAISKVLEDNDYTVFSSDLHNYGYGLIGTDFFKVKKPDGVEGVITNPPYKLALQFAAKAISEVPYVALLLRTNFLESTSRLPFFRSYPPARIWISSRRLPMMHRFGWTGPKSVSNTCHAWFVWDHDAEIKSRVNWFDFKDYMGERK